ncbi:hypothetical protein [Faecalimonas sp.]
MDKKWAENYRKQISFSAGVICVIVAIWLVFTGIELYTNSGISKRWCLFTVLILGIESAFAFWKRSQMKKIQNVLYEECDPFRFKEIYEYFRAKTKKTRVKNIYNIQISIALFMQGYEDSAYELINQIDFSDLPPRFELNYYDFMRMYFSCKNDERQLAKIKSVFENKLSKANTMERKMIIQQIKYMDLQVAINRKEYEVYDKLIAECNSEMNRMLQKVSVYMLMAKAEFGRGNVNKAKECCQFVLQHGNRTYYVKNAQKLLDIIDGKTVEEPQVEKPIEWEINQLYKEKPDLKFFDSRKKYKRKQRMMYLLWMVLGFSVGFIIYGTIGMKIHQDLSEMVISFWENKILFGLQTAILGGWLIAGILNGVYLFLKVINKMSLGIKILMILFTMPLFLLAGLLSLIPYCIYQIAMIVKEREKKK